MAEISFRRSGHPYLNAGIVGVYRYLDDARRKLRRAAAGTAALGPADAWLEELPPWEHALSDEELRLTTDDPIPLLEEIYYAMGRDHYGTSTRQAVEQRENIYYDTATDNFVHFPKKKTYGFGALLTNDAAGKTRDETKLLRQKSIKPDDVFGQRVLQRHKAYADEHHIKLGQQLYVDEPYVKITRLQLTERDLKPGNQICPLTGEGFARLQNAINVQPTVSGLKQFASGLSDRAEKIGWKALYLMRFVPELAFYTYTRGLEVMYCYVYDAPTLTQLAKLRKDWASIYLDSVLKQNINHLSNFRLAHLSPPKVSGAEDGKMDRGSRDFVHANEILFQLAYTIAVEQAGGYSDEATGQLTEEEEQGVSIHLIRAEKYSGTMRPKEIRAVTHFDRTLSLIRRLRLAEESPVDWPTALRSLVLTKPRFGKKSEYEQSRLTRNIILGKLMAGQPFIPEYASLLYDCYGLRQAGGRIGYKSFRQLDNLFQHTHLDTRPNSDTMNDQTGLSPELRKRAYNLGVQIGEQIMRYGQGSDSASARAKAGRKYIVHLNKVRTYTDFLEAVVRLLNRHDGLIPSRELFEEQLDADNFEAVKLLCVIGALTRVNSKLSQEEAGKKSKTPETT